MSEEPDDVMSSLAELVGLTIRLLKEDEESWYDQLDRICNAYQERMTDLRISESTLDEFTCGDFFTILAIAIEGAHQEIPRLRAINAAQHQSMLKMESEITRLKLENETKGLKRDA